jgi:hypothetical protein
VQGQQGRSHLVCHDVKYIGFLGRHDEYLVQWTANVDRILELRRRLNYEERKKKMRESG